jgi:hypothetical protein
MMTIATSQVTLAILLASLMATLGVTQFASASTGHENAKPYFWVNKDRTTSWSSTPITSDHSIQHQLQVPRMK